MNTNKATKGAGIESFTTVSKGSRKAQVIVILEGGVRETRHLLLKDNVWQDRLGNTYEGV